jgi:putative hydrolase of the HAD superfamily
VKLRAVIFDIYGTLLEVGPPPADAHRRWERLWKDLFSTWPRLTLEHFGQECERVIAAEHAAARASGILFPEVYWPAVVSSVLPEVARLPESERDEFCFDHAQMIHTVGLLPGSAAALRAFQGLRLRLGLASNSQPYTVRELDLVLAQVGLSRELFMPELCFFSFEHGFSKPDAHVFGLLTARLRALGLTPAETLMVGDRPDNDLAAASAWGWQTWHLSPAAVPDQGGGWEQLIPKLQGA